jgi:hypothetical protein
MTKEELIEIIYELIEGFEGGQMSKWRIQQIKEQIESLEGLES